MPVKSRIRLLLFGLIISTALTITITVRNISNQGKAATTSTTVTFQPTGDEIPNPERGFMRQSNIQVNQPYSSSALGKKDPNDTVDWVYFHLEGYRDPRDGKGVTLTNYQFVPLEPVGSGKGLDTVKRTFDDARSKGLKLVIRFLYVGYGGIGSTNDFASKEPDAPLDVALRHIDQLAPVIQQDKDVIAAIQTGFVGYWGEWHSSKYLDSIENRRAVTAAVLAASPKDRMVQLRYPRYAQLFYGGPLTESQAFNQSDLARLGLHNDAFLKDDIDGGTLKSTYYGTKITTYCDNYPTGETQCWRDYYGQTSRYTPSGGEAGTHSSTPSVYADCSNALVQLNNLHFSFLHNGYSMVTLNHWINQGCMPEIRRRLGYRLVLKSLTIPPQVNPGGIFPIQLTLENQGFAAPYNPRPVILVLKEKSSGQVREIPLTSVDPRRWLPGSIININTQVTVPSNTPAGVYTVYLWLPDASSSLRSRPEYAIRLANLNLWQSASGYNLLFDNLSVGGAVITSNPPTPTRTPTPVQVTNPVQPTRTPTPIIGTCSRKSQGDSNCDGLVDLIDFEIWRREFTGSATSKNADFNVDTFVDLVDFEIWRRIFAG